MARPHRFNLEGIPQYITQLGISREPVFFDNKDYQYYLECLYEASVKWHCQVHAYSLLPNHIHILLTPNIHNGVSKCMQSVNRRYVQYINLKYGRRGTIWSGRHTSSLVDNRFILDCYCHIEWAPVYARLANTPAEYPWSSYHAHINGMASYILNDHIQYLQLHSNIEERKAHYRQHIYLSNRQQQMDVIRKAIRYGHVIGDDGFKQWLRQQISITNVKKKRGRPRKALN